MATKTTTSTTKATAKKAGAKLPEDHKEKSSSYADLEGAHLLKPISQLRRSEAAMLTLSLATALGDDIAELEEIDTENLTDEEGLRLVSGMNPAGVAKVMDTVEDNFVTDLDAWEALFPASKWKDAMNLCFAYVGEVGKDAS